MIIGKTSKSCKQKFLFPDCDSFCVLLNCIYLLISIITLTWYIFTIQLLIKRDSNKTIDKNRKLIVYFSIYLGIYVLQMLQIQLVLFHLVVK